MTTPAQAQPNDNNSADSSTLEPQFMYEHQIPMPQDMAPRQDMRAVEAAASRPHPIRQAESGPAPVIQTDNLSKVYEQAGVRAPNHGFTILKVADMVSSAHIRDLSIEGKRAAVLMALEVHNVQLNDVIEDAARRDLALNQYEARQQKTFQDFKNWKQQQNKEIQAEIDTLVEACRSRLEENEKEIVSEKARLDEWRTKKREEERRIRTASSHFAQSGAAEQNSNSTEPAAAALPEGPPALTSTRIKPMEARLPERPAESNASANGANKRLSLWKR